VNGLRHPFTGALYEQTGDGTIKVTESDGRSGVFGRDGHWIDGDVRECDPQLCNWVGGPIYGNHRLAPATK
jgi:hypothetical protein